MTPEYYQVFLAEWEVVEGFMETQNEADQFLEDWDDGFDEPILSNEQFITDFGPVDPCRVI